MLICPMQEGWHVPFMAFSDLSFFLVLHIIVVLSKRVCNKIVSMSYFESVHTGKICPVPINIC